MILVRHMNCVATTVMDRAKNGTSLMEQTYEKPNVMHFSISGQLSSTRGRSSIL